MAKFVLYRCTSVQIGGVLYKKADGVVFDTEDPKFKKVKAEIEAAAEKGFLEDVSKGSNEDRKAKAEIKNAAREKETLKAEKLEAEKLEAEKLEAEKLEAEKLEAEEREAEELEAEELEAERGEADKLKSKKSK